MRDKEQIPVFVLIERGKTVCLCKQGKRHCDNPDCIREMVERDAYNGLATLARQDKYGKVKERLIREDV